MSINQLLKDITNKNIAKDLSKDEIDSIAHIVSEGFDRDYGDDRRQKWVTDIKEYIDIAMQIVEEKSDPWEGCANIKLPILTEMTWTTGCLDVLF